MVKTFKNHLLRNQEADDLETWYIYSIGYSSTTKFVQMMTLGWPWPFLWHGQICFLMLLHGWKLVQHIVKYFQACSNSAYPMHTDERYRTNGPLVVRWKDNNLLHFLFSASPNPRTAAVYYFIVAIVVLLIAFDAYFVLPLTVSGLIFKYSRTDKPGIWR